MSFDPKQESDVSINSTDAESDHNYGVSDELVQQVTQTLESEPLKIKKLKSLLNIEQTHAADIGDLISKLRTNEVEILLPIIIQDIEPETLVYVDHIVKNDLVELLGIQKIASLLSRLVSDDALEFLKETPLKTRNQILDLMPRRDSLMLKESLTYPKDSAGRIMKREVVFVPSFWDVGKTLDYLKKSNGLPEDFQNVIVVGPKHRPVGQIKLSSLLRQERNDVIQDFMETDVKVVSVSTDQEEVANLFKHYTLMSCPVVDSSGRIVGIITVDDIVEVIQEEADEDIMHLGGVSALDNKYGIFNTSWHRLIWLAVSVIGALGTTLVIDHFSQSINNFIFITAFMPLSGALGGSVATQVMTVVIRALTNKDLRNDNRIEYVNKEILVNIINGVILAGLFGIAALFISSSNVMGIIVATALFSNIVFASIIGSLLPIVLDNMKFDPAISSGPVISAVIDISGYLIYFITALLLL